MLFSSFEFLFRFLPVFLVIYYLTPKKFRNVTLLGGSIVFYTIGEAGYITILLACVLVNYTLTRLMYRKNTDGRGIRQKRLLLLALGYDLGVLFFFKYSGLASGLPLGISFYTFTMLSYVLDVYKKKTAALRDYLEYGTYILLFPKLISGPIAQFANMAGQLKKHPIRLEKIEHGLTLFIIGLGYKVIIANHLAILWRDIQGIGFESISTPLAWMGAFGYSAQLFFDFQGYSLMAIGIGEMLGFDLPKNFDHPYRSRTVSEFYRRWHITLGRWFRDYLYIPLGGNRKGNAWTFFNLLIVWVVTGMWHGSTINFPLWGLILFVFIALERFVIRNFLEKHGWLAHLYIWFVIPLTWVVFAITKLSDLKVYFARLFPFFGTGIAVNAGDYLKYGRTYGVFFLLAFVVSLPFMDKILKKCWKKWWMKAILFVVLWICIYQIANGLNNPFMYFSF